MPGFPFRRRPVDHDPGGLLAWGQSGSDLRSGRYLIRCLGPHCWELTCGDRLVGVHRHLSTARRFAELDHREVLRRRDITVWGTTAAAALIASVFLLAAWGVGGFFGFVAAVLVMSASVARMLAAVSRSMYDPYRRRDPWEAPDWWNRRM